MLREIASHINIIITTSMVLIAIFLATGLNTLRPTSNYSTILIRNLPFLAVFLFIISVLAAWYSGNSNHVAIGGLLPWNDAYGYYQCAHTLLDKWELGQFCHKRPLYNFYLATLIGMSGRDLQITLLLQAVLLGCVVYLFARQLAYYLGGIAALVAFALLFLFASDYSMTTLTENAGLFYGTLGFVFIWVGTKKKNIALISFGVFMLTLGLNARAGAFFVLPFIVIWAVFFSGLRNTRRYIMVSSIVIAILGGFIFNAGLYYSIDARYSSSNTNFSHALYGITAGGKSWDYVYKAEPEIFSESYGSEGERAREIYAASLRNIIHQPHLFIKGYFKGFLHYMEKLFHFVRTTRHEESLLRITFGVFWLAGLVSCIKGIRRDPHLALVASMAAGVMLSAPLITLSGSNRVFAATMCIDAALVAIGFTAFQQMIKNRRMVLVRLQDGKREELPRYTILFSIVMLFLIFPGPILMRQVVALAPINSSDCDKGLTPFVIRPGLESTSLRITGNKNETSLFPVQILVEDYRLRLINRWVHLDRELVKLPMNTTLIWAYQRSEKDFGKGTLMIWPDSVPVKKGLVIHACVKTGAYEKIPGFARVETVDIIAD